MDGDNRTQLPWRPLSEANQCIAHARRTLTNRTPSLLDVRQTVEDIHEIAGELTTLVGLLRERAEAAFGDTNQHVLGELERDLHAMYGCLTTAGLLIAPAVEDLRELSSGVARDSGQPESRMPVRPPDVGVRRAAITVIDGESFDAGHQAPPWQEIERAGG
ncbi:hypothetical protein [Haloechinothrix salitolerans]|uniref:Hpt domain-containing protein n=1 Tax=Haloechinothrix salitolerans TaxID=926830 RepID=A0ABW2C547_9PSEU